jgi:hypothetical protein
MGGTKIDRFDGSYIKTNASNPSKGNIYINTSDYTIRHKKDNGQWTSLSLWKRVSNILSPANTGDGLTIAATGTNEINLSTQDDFNIAIGGGGKFLLNTNGSSDGSVSFLTTGTGVGDFTVNTTSSGNGNISFYAGGTLGNVLFDLGGSNSSFTVNIDSGTDGSISFSTVGSGTGNFSVETEGDFTVWSPNGDIRIGSMGTSAYLNINESSSEITLRSGVLSLEGVSTDADGTVFIGFTSIASILFDNADDSIMMNSNGNLDIGSGTDLTITADDSVTVGSVGDEVYLVAHSSSIQLNSAGQASLSTTAQSIVGAINEIDGRFSGGFTGTVSSPSSITVSNGIVTAVS